MALVDVIGDRVELKRRGTLHVGLCPIHSERTASFTVRNELGRFKCYGCGAGGDAIDFLTLVDGVSFREAVEILAERAGVVVPADTETRGNGPSDGTLRAALADAHQLFRSHIASDAAAEAREYLSERSFEGSHIEQWELGYSPGPSTILAALRSRGHTLTVLEAAGLIRRSQRGSYYDAFCDRLIWPLHDSAGRLCGFAGRALGDRQPKYSNSAEGLFHKRSTLFGLWAARRHILTARAVIVVEGYTDVMAFAAAEYPNVVATSGTAFTTEHAKLLAGRIGDDGEIISAFDDDNAGRKATWDLFLKCQHFTSRINALDFSGYGDKSDGCQVRAQAGAAALARVVDRKVPALQMLVAHDCQLPENHQPEDVAVAARRVTDRLRQVTSPILRRAYLERGAALLGISVDDLTAGAPPPASTTPQARPVPPPIIVDPDHTLLAAILITDPHEWVAVTAATHVAALDELFDSAVAQLVQCSWSAYPSGRPVAGEDAPVWVDYMLRATDPEHHSKLWDIAYCDISATTTTAEALGLRIRRVQLHHIIEESRGDPDRHDRYMTAYRELRNLKQRMPVL